MTLHKAIANILVRRSNRPLTAREIADEIAQLKLYVRGDGLFPPSGQVTARIGQYSHFFVIDRTVQPQHYCLSQAGLNTLGS